MTSIGLDLLLDSLRYDRTATLELAASVPEPHCGTRAGGVGQTPAWIVAHLHLADSRQGLRYGVEPVCDLDGLMRDVGPASDLDRAADAVRTHFGDWAGAIRASTESHARLLAAIAAAPEELLLGPHPAEEVREWFPTLAHNLVYAVWHEGNHGGQLRAWMHAARAAGLLPAAG
ncbi:MAG: DinB family protein [Planctomycetota bacterium]